MSTTDDGSDGPVFSAGPGGALPLEPPDLADLSDCPAYLPRHQPLPSDDEIALDDSLMAGLGSGSRGLLITFEGLDGSGKSTQLEVLAAALRERGYPVVATREPGGTSLGEAVRAMLLDVGQASMSAKSEALLYVAARAQLVEEVIHPALEEGAIVLCDRYLDSSLAYQGFGRDLGADNMMMLSVWATDCLFPDLTLVFFLEDETRLGRADAQPDRLERERADFFARVEQGYRRLVRDHPHRIREIDAAGDVEEVAARVAAVVDEELGLFRDGSPDPF